MGTQLGRALRKLGLERREELAPLMRAMAAEARLGSTDVAVASVELSIDDPALSPAEREVAEAVLRGRSDREIARERRTSERTVANQLRSVFRKLSVGSRAELVARASRGSE
ncbi:MAG: helix-turn-helix transcriptional regulator [Sandaracinaceae bacterium]|nr:helix-turn-helix transcriptional regulator [Sandaracinaceae bacterium]